MTVDKVLVTGATSVIGPYLLDRLAGREVHAFSRRPAFDTRPGVVWHQFDLEGPVGTWPVRDVPLLIHLASLWLLPEWIGPLAEAGVKRIVAFGSTSRFTKAASAVPRERELASRLAFAEDALAERASRHGVHWTLLRPTLVYDGRRDKNLAAVRSFILRWGFFPIAGQGRGLRQPVHADDLAAASLAAAASEAAMDRAYDVPGGTTLTYRAMVEIVFAALGRRPRLLQIPLGPLRLALRAASLIPRFGYLTPEMATRMDQDLCFTDAAARMDFGYRPRPFSTAALPGAEGQARNPGSQPSLPSTAPPTARTIR